jgi:GTPase SAR1 family protein
MDLFPFKNYDDYSSNINSINHDHIELVGLDDCRRAVKEWYYSTEQLLLLVGPTGCGKSSLVKLFCKEENIILYDYIPKKDIVKDITLFTEYTSGNFFNKQNFKKLVLFDEYASFNLTDIKNLLLIQNIKILIISADSRGSKLSDFKIYNIYYIDEIPRETIRKFLKDKKLVVSDYLINTCKSDIRLLLNNINSGLTYKNSDTNIPEFINNLFLKKLTLNEIYKTYEIDGFHISNLVHENYLDYSNSIESIANSAESISYGETVFSDTYESTRTFIPHTHCTNALVLPSYYSDLYNIQSIRSSIINNRFNIYLNNKKIIDKINLNLTKRLSITDILYIKKFLNQQLIKNKNITESQLSYLKSIMELFPDSKIERLELIYKHFSDFRDPGIKEPKTKNFTLKFKEKLKCYVI